jgi:hypothetical protein
MERQKLLPDVALEHKKNGKRRSFKYFNLKPNNVLGSGVEEGPIKMY